MKFRFGIPICVWLVVATIAYRAESSVRSLGLGDMKAIRGGQANSCVGPANPSGQCPKGTTACNTNPCGDLYNKDGSYAGYGCLYFKASQKISQGSYPLCAPAASGSNACDQSTFNCFQLTPCNGTCKAVQGGNGVQMCSTGANAVATPDPDPASTVLQSVPKPNDPCPVPPCPPGSRLAACQ